MTEKSKKNGRINIERKRESGTRNGRRGREKRRNDKAWRMIENYQKQLSETAR